MSRVASLLTIVHKGFYFRNKGTPPCRRGDFSKYDIINILVINKAILTVLESKYMLLISGN